MSDIFKNLLFLNKNVVGVFPPYGFTVHEQVIKLSDQTLEALLVDGLIFATLWEQF